jgi:hypothetical protein
MVGSEETNENIYLYIIYDRIFQLNLDVHNKKELKDAQIEFRNEIREMVMSTATVCRSQSPTLRSRYSIVVRALPVEVQVRFFADPQMGYRKERDRVKRTGRPSRSFDCSREVHTFGINSGTVSAILVWPTSEVIELFCSKPNRLLQSAQRPLMSAAINSAQRVTIRTVRWRAGPFASRDAAIGISVNVMVVAADVAKAMWP